VRTLSPVSGRRYFLPAMNLIPQAVRRGVMQLLGPLVRLLVRLHVRPNTITTLGTLVVMGSAFAFARGRAHWAGFLLLLSGVFDMLDGRVARDGGGPTVFGAFYDSTLDRVGESALFTGIAVGFLRGGIARDWLTLAIVLSSAALASSLLVSYTRARAEALGIQCTVGIVQRAERVVLLGVPTLFLGAGRDGVLLFWIVAVLAMASTVTVVQRVVHVARAARGPGVRAVRARETVPGRAAVLHSRKGT
jgi:CDP-diacylglycerol--glycerol-3-phosphate 3-phosphatidyltransferase